MHDGELWQAFAKVHVVYDPVTGEKKREYEPPSDYSESLAWVDGRLWNVSFSDSNLWVGTPGEDGFRWEIAGTTPESHAWGIAFTGEHVIVTGNGTPFLYFLDPGTTDVVHVVETPIDDLEDLAWDGESIWATSYVDLPGKFFRLDPATGEVLDVFEVPAGEAAQCTDRILDGLAIDDGLLYVTGKRCPYVWVYTLW